MIRVQPLAPHRFVFLYEPMAAVRLNYHARFTAQEGSSEWQYVRWKDAIRDLFDQLDYRDRSIGIPFDEPLSLSGRFLVSENFDAKDLDNLIKGIFDAMNPVRRKNFSELRTFLWVDDKCVKRFGTWESIPNIEPRIDLEVTPLWGRADPMLHFIDGVASSVGGGMYNINVQLPFDYYPFNCVAPAGVKQPIDACRVWVIRSASNGCHTVVSSPEQAIFFRELVKLPRISEDFAVRVLEVPWDDVCEGLATGKAQCWSAKGVQLGVAARAISQLRELFTSPEKRMITLAEKFDQTVFEEVAAEVSQRVGILWSVVRRSLASADLDWHGNLEAVIAAAMQVVEDEHAPKKRKKEPNAARSRRRAAH